jgi:hypothetical protein
MRYAAAVSEQDNPTSGNSRSSTPGRHALWLLLIPVAALIFPGIYNRETPTLFGFPYFYWYQLMWVFLATIVLGLVYWLTRGSRD